MKLASKIHAAVASFLNSFFEKKKLIENLSLFFYLLYVFSIFYLDFHFSVLTRVIFFLSLAFSVLYFVKNFQTKLKIVPFLNSFFLLVVYSFITILFSAQKEVAVSSAITLAGLVLIIFLGLCNLDTIFKIHIFLVVLIISCCFMCCLSFVYYDKHELISALTGGVFRIGTDLNQPNAFGFFCFLGIAACTYFFFRNPKKDWPFAFPALFFGVFMVGTQSRSSLLQTIAFFVFVFILLFSKKGQKNHSFLIIGLVVIFLLLGIFFVALFTMPALSRFANSVISALEGETDSSTIERKILINVYFQLFLDNPIFGYGAGQGPLLVYSIYGYQLVAHYLPLDIAVNFGLFGLLFWYFSYGYFCSVLLRSKTKNHLFYFSLFLFLAFLIHDFFATSYLSKISYLVLGFFFSCANVLQSDRENNPSCFLPAVTEGSFSLEKSQK